jgi:hypothetical protein
VLVLILEGAVRLADTKNNHQGRYGEAYFHVLATAAGAVATKVEYDMEGVDFFVGLPREVRGIRFPKIEVQVKSVSNLQPSASGAVWRFRDLNEDQYNNLAGPDFRVPRLLVLITVPKTVSSYACADANALTLSHAAYWLSLEDQPMVADPSTKRHVIVDVPTANLLTVESLLSLFEPRPGDVRMAGLHLWEAS